MIKSVSKSDSQLLAQVQAQMAEITDKKNGLNEKKTELESVEAELDSQKSDLLSKQKSIEKNSEAVGLINANKIKFAADNLEIIQGEATECIDKLEAPTHAFIGGSSGNLCKILDMIYSKNPSCRIVLNAISLETVSNALGYLKEHGIKPVEILEISVSKAKETGTHHLMMGQNPITIIVF